MFKLRAALLVVGFIGIGYSMTFAQSDTACEVVIDDVLETIQTQCSDLGSGQACLAENSSAFVEDESPISPD
jgi:hypothetical protein